MELKWVEEARRVHWLSYISFNSDREGIFALRFHIQREGDYYCLYVIEVWKALYKEIRPVHAGEFNRLVKAKLAAQKLLETIAAQDVEDAMKRGTP